MTYRQSSRATAVAAGRSYVAEGGVSGGLSGRVLSVSTDTRLDPGVFGDEVGVDYSPRRSLRPHSLRLIQAAIDIESLRRR
jgi:hypothetical protein